MNKFISNNFKNLLLAGLFITLSSQANAYCLVSNEDGGTVVENDYVPTGNPADAEDESLNSLTYQISTLYHDGLCSTRNDDPFDFGLGLTQAILFATREFGFFDEDADQITLNRPVAFNNPNQNIVIGNFPIHRPLPEFAYQYPADFDPRAWGEGQNAQLLDYGMVYINAVSNFTRKENKMPFICHEDTSPIVLRNLVIETIGITREEFFSQDESSCLFDGGDVFICNGKVKRIGGVPVDPRVDDDYCGPNPRVDNDGDGYVDCNDSDCSAKPVFALAIKKCVTILRTTIVTA